MLLLVNCSQQPVDNTARSGKLSIAIDQQLESMVTSQCEAFNRYYPDARITLIPATSRKTLKYFLNHTAKAVLISSEIQPVEESILATLKHPIRREPVARDAIVCIVNHRNPVKSLSLDDLARLYTKPGEEILPLFNVDDYRLIALFAKKTSKKKGDLHAWGCSSDRELIERVAVDDKAVGLLFRSSLDAVLSSVPRRDNIRIIPLSKDKSSESVYLPTPQNIYNGYYPLVTTVYYVYYSSDALAMGFGSWLGSLGQKGFERSFLVPFRLVERTIILK